MRWEGKGNWIPILFQQLLYKASQLQSLIVGSYRLKKPNVKGETNCSNNAGPEGISERKKKEEKWHLRAYESKSSPQIHARAWTEIADIIPFWLNFVEFRSYLSVVKWIMFDRGPLSSERSLTTSSKHCQLLRHFKKSLCKTLVSAAWKENWNCWGQDTSLRWMV